MRHTDQLQNQSGAQFASNAFTGLQEAAGTRTRMDGQCAQRDNIFINRFWWSVKKREVSLKANGSVGCARHNFNAHMA